MQVAHIFTNTLRCKVLQQLELTQGAQCEHGMIERGDLLDGDLGARRPVRRRNDDAVRAFPNDVQNLVRGAWG
jgi:hypothetical protein